jgi:apolipoprotein N-acyltransferase
VNALFKVLRFWPWLAAITTGLLYTLCFAPFNQWWLCFFALTPLLTAVWFSGGDSSRRWQRDLLLGYVAGLAFFWPVFSWLTTVTVVGWILVGAYMAVYFAVWSLFVGLLRPRTRVVIEEEEQKPLEGVAAVTQRLLESRGAAAIEATRQRAGRAAPPREEELPRFGAPAVDPALRRSPWLSNIRNLWLAFLLSAAWVTVELIRGTLFSGWGWNMLGSALHSQWPLIQIVEFTGVAGLSFVAAWTNVILVATVRRLMIETQVKPIKPHFDFTVTMVMLMGIVAYGIRAVQVTVPSQALRVSAVQPNIPRDQKFNQEFAAVTFEQFERLSQIGMQSKPDLLMWPESALPDTLHPETGSYRFVFDFAQRTGVDLLLGIIDQDEVTAYNAAVLVTEAGARTQWYRKIHLVPFGEYVPGRHTLPGVARIVGDQVPEDFGFGKEHAVFDLTKPNVRVAPLICFEDTIGELTRRFVLAGANLLANVTNDGWFKETAGSQQHLANAIFRCVETRLPMVRSANTGVTCFINRYGRVTEVLLDEKGSQFTEGVLSGTVAVPLKQPHTFYVRHGELFARACAGVTTLALLGLIVGLIRRRVSS